MSLPPEERADDGQTPEDPVKESQQLGEPENESDIEIANLPPPPLVTVGPLSEEPEEGTLQHPPAGEDLP
ncbi:MAG: hypothetical protein H0U82_05150 [Actinobacteria bacterium]|nr:hypothetical protein [Actinomycetota bacterium]